MSADVDKLSELEKMRLAKQHFHELIEAKNKQLIENEEELKKLRLLMRLVLK